MKRWHTPTLIIEKNLIGGTKMGTRHLICVVKDGEYRVAQYGQWDGYPGGQGIDILAFLTNIDRETFESKVDNLSWITDSESQAQWNDCGANGSTTVKSSVADLHNEKYPENSRDTGAKILSVIQGSDKSLKLMDNLEFASDSLFCEWAYVIDLDKNVFEVYKGFNEEPVQNERFSMFEKKGESLEIDGEAIITTRIHKYHPVKFAKSFELNNLPSCKEFLEFFEDDEE